MKTILVVLLKEGKIKIPNGTEYSTGITWPRKIVPPMIEKKREEKRRDS